jgi:hypothetical protein
VDLFIRDNGFTKVLCIVALVTALGLNPLCAVAAAPDSGIPTNFEIIDRVCSEVAQEIVLAVGTIPRGDIVLLNKAKSAGTIDFVLENALVMQMRNAGLRAAVEPAQKDPTTVVKGDYRLSYQIVRLNLTYPRVSRSWGFGSKKVTRQVRADVFVQFVNLATGDVDWVKEVHKEYRDTIPYSALRQVEEAQYDFTRPPHSEFKMTRLLEPLVVGGIVVGLVYLFFSNQSSK